MTLTTTEALSPFAAKPQTMIKCRCGTCGAKFEIAKRHYKDRLRASITGQVFCNRRCAGKAGGRGNTGKSKIDPDTAHSSYDLRQINNNSWGFLKPGVSERNRQAIEKEREAYMSRWRENISLERNPKMG